MNLDWSIRGDDLNDRTRSGGVSAEKGFNFQKAYAIVRLTWLPTGERGLAEVRYEGAQDVDLRFGDGREVLVQAKNYQRGGITLAVLHSAIAGFARDVISVKASGDSTRRLPEFRLLCTSAPEEEKALELLRGSFFPHHASVIAPLISSKYRKGFDDDKVIECVLEALDRTIFEIVIWDDAISDLKAQASWNLARIGVPVEHVTESLAKLYEALSPRKTFQISDVVENLVGLPYGHPGRDDAACHWLPSSRHLPMTSTLRTEFLRGSMQSLWCAVANNMDIKREELADVTNALNGIAVHGGMVVVEGAGGTGKSTLVRRGAWNASRSGLYIVLDVPSPGDVDEASWNAVTALLTVTTRPVLLVVDDVWRHQGFIKELDRKIRPNLCVLATSRPGEKPTIPLRKLLVNHIALRPLSKDFVSGLRSLVCADQGDSPDTKDGQITRFAETGQLLALSLTLQSGSLSQFAKGILEPLQSQRKMLNDFVRLCVAGRYDQTAPLSLFERSRAAADRFWLDDSFSGLAAVQSGAKSKRLRVGHSVVAQAIVEVAGIDPVSQTFEICSCCDPVNLDERRFVIRLLLSTAEDESLTADFRSQAGMLETVADRLLPAASFADVHRLAAVLELAGQEQKAHTYLKAATPDRVRDAVDVGLALSRKSPNEFAQLYPAIFGFFDKENDAPGRRRFVIAVLQRGTSRQQAEVADQTARWAVQRNFPGEETRALFVLAAGAPDKEVAWQVVPALLSYLASGSVSMEAMPAAVHLVKRIKDNEVSRIVIWHAMKLVESAKTWHVREIHLARMLVGPVRDACDDEIKLKLSSLLLQMLEQIKDIKHKRSVLRGAISVTPLQGVDSLRETIAELKRQYANGEMDEVEIQFHRHFKLGSFATISN